MLPPKLAVKKLVAPLVPKYAPLPTQTRVEGSKLNELKFLAYGAAGVGKSTLFSKAISGTRKPLYLHTDPGLRWIKAYKQPIFEWKAFKFYTDEILKDPTKAAKTYSMIVLDTVDLLYRLCRKEVCRSKGWAHVSEGEWGKGTDMVRDEFEQTIIKIAKLDEFGIGLGFTSHMKTMEVMTRGAKIQKTIPSMPKGALEVILPLCDVVAYCSFAENERTSQNIAIFKPQKSLEAKDRTGLLPERCSLDFDVIHKYLDGETPNDKIIQEKIVESSESEEVDE